jgi:hypothetical protein
MSPGVVLFTLSLWCDAYAPRVRQGWCSGGCRGFGTLEIGALDGRFARGAAGIQLHSRSVPRRFTWITRSGVFPGIPSFAHLRPNWVHPSSPAVSSLLVGSRLYTFFQSV